MPDMSKFATGFPILMIVAIALLPSCVETCPQNEMAEVGGEFFTVTYEDAAGVNYLTNVYDQDKIVVYLDTTGGESPRPDYELILPGFENGKFGPFTFTERFIDPTNQAPNAEILFGQPYSFDYYIRKDTFGVDTFKVDFLLDVDECSSFWRSIRYYRNGEPLPQYDDQQLAEIVIVE